MGKNYGEYGMVMEVRFIDKEQSLPVMNAWYEGWGKDPLPDNLLPRYGLMVSNDGEDVCAAWLYVTDGKLGLFEGAIMDPKAPRERRKGTIAFLIQNLNRLSKEVGCEMVMIISKDRHVTKVAKEQGFTCLKEDYKVLMRSV